MIGGYDSAENCTEIEGNTSYGENVVWNKEPLDKKKWLEFNWYFIKEDLQSKLDKEQIFSEK